MNPPNISIVIQCRDASTRYKHKSVRPFYNRKSILQLLLARFSHLPYNVVVTTSLKSPKTIEQATEAGVDITTGPEGDVLARMCEVVEAYNLDGIFRVCADNPFIQLPLMYPVVAWMYGNDYVAFDQCMKRHEGFFVEYVSREALFDAEKHAEEMYDRENVTSHVYNNPHIYRVGWLEIPEEFNAFKIRLTVDTQSDFEIAQEVYAHVGERHWMWILNYLYENKELLKKMEKNIRRNEK